jgi:U6 snRNA-associated Sm-like protein LSm5
MSDKVLGVGHILPLEVLDKCIGRPVWVHLKKDREFYGVLQGFDEFLNMVVADCKEYLHETGKARVFISKNDIMLLNGSHVCLVVPGENTELTKATNEKV